MVKVVNHSYNIIHVMRIRNLVNGSYVVLILISTVYMCSKDLCGEHFQSSTTGQEHTYIVNTAMVTRGVTSLFGDRRHCCTLTVAIGHSKLGGSGGMPPPPQKFFLILDPLRKILTYFLAH